MRRVVITGATGVVGMAIVRKCIEKGIEAVLLVNPASPRLARIPDDPLVKVVKCGLEDMRNENPEPSPILTQADAFIHLSWGGTFGDVRNDKALQDKNAEYALDAVRLAHRLGCKVFVGAGSQAEYGRVEGVLKPDTPCTPENEYGRAKLRASIETREMCREYGIRHVWPRILSIYGPYDGEKTMVMSLISSLLSGEKLSLTAGEQMWDYLYADDAGEAMLSLAEHGLDGGTYPIGSGTARPLREYIEIIRDQIDPSLPLGFGEVPYSDKQVMYLCADISKLCEDTGFSPKVGFAEGARRTIEWVRKQ
ncbi:MAG: NAD(P)-dependent oxidoreductase [Lachnospiraceae bacterium]|nr:NAD(P)-dependent oxidoreductase [Lachnospiraceae bacterium]